MPILTASEFARIAGELVWILCDVDGVLTDGSLYYDRRGEALKRFHVRDGLALKLAQRAGLRVGLLSGRESPALERRAAELGLDALLAGHRDKDAVFDEFLRRHDTVPRQVAYIGDDLPDLPVLGRCGLAFAPADAAEEVRAVAHRILARPGGAGAVREMVEMVLRARGDWDALFASFTFDRG